MSTSNFNKENSNSNTENSNINIPQAENSNINPFPEKSALTLFCKDHNEINSQNENGWTPIYNSVITNNLECLNELLKLGANPNIPNLLNETPLYQSIEMENYDALIILLQYNSDCNISKNNGMSPLHLASQKKLINFISALLRHGANPNLQNLLFSQTPLHISIINKSNEDILKLFFKFKGDCFFIKDKFDKSPFDYAIDNGIEYQKMVEKIFKNDNLSDKDFNENKIIFKNNTPKNFNDTIKEEEDDYVSSTKIFQSSNNNDTSGKNNSFINSKSNNKILDDKILNEKIFENKDFNNESYSKEKVNDNKNLSIDNFNEENLLIKKNSNENIFNTIKKNNDIKENLKANFSNSIKKINITEDNLNINLSTPRDNKTKNLNSFLTSNSKKETNNSKKEINSEINPLDLINQVITTNSNIFSELQNSNQNNQKDTFSDLSYSKTKSYIISDHNQTNQKKNDKSINSNLSIESNFDIKSENNSSIKKKNVNKKINFENKENYNPNINFIDINKKENNNSNIYIKKFSVKNNNNNNNSFSSSNNNNNSNNSINSFIKNNNNNNSNSDNSFHSTITNNKSKTFQNKKIYNINSNKNNTLIDNNNHFISKTFKNKRHYQINPESKIINLNNSNILSLNTTRPSIPSMQYNSNTNPNKINIINNNQNNNNKEVNTTFNSNNNSLYNKINSQNNLFHASTSSNNLSFSTLNTPYYKNNNIQNSFLNEYAFENGKWINNNNVTNDKSLNEDFLVEQNLIGKLRDYLISCDLINYLNLFLENEIIDIEKLIEGVKKNELKIEYKDIEDLGIKKPGHIFRFLLKIEIDSKLINDKIVDYIFNNLNTKKNDLNLSICDFKPCCNLGKNNSYTKYNDIFSFLQSKNLAVLKDNLLHNGFENIEYLLIQMFSKYCFNDEMLTEYFHIYNDELKRKFLKEMYKEKKKIYNILKIPYYEKFIYKNESLELNSENEENCNLCNIF